MSAHKLFISGKWVKSTSHQTFKSYNPATEKIIGTFEAGNQKDVEKAVAAAQKSLPFWKNVPAPQRAKILFRLARLLERDKEKLARALTEEMGKIISEARGDVQEAIDTAEYFAGEGRRLFGHTTPSELRDKAAFTIRQPFGVVGLIAPWNFPIAIPAWKICPALVCGNTIVFKPSSDTPRSAIQFVQLLVEAGLPSGVLNLVTGTGKEVGLSLVKHPEVRMISFTGSRETGKTIVQNAGIKKVGLELGGKNPIIIMDDANLELALEGVLFGAFGTTGQRCTATSRIIIHQKVQKKFEKRLVNRVRRLKVGNGLLSKTDVGPLINQRALEKVHSYTLLGKQQGAKLLCGGSSLKGKGFFYKPTVFTNVKSNMRIAQEEIFGPFLSIIPAKNFAHAIKIANNVSYGLSASIYTENISFAFKAINEIESGLVYVNSSTIGSEVHLPFGGIKGTGNGTREAGIEGINEFSETKTIYIDYSDKLQKAQIDEFKLK
ncbi:aldehyde dehydrogenase family protein [Candidatus Micrarchaeota archaeon]|nr:aldehyde dehydrogenase family protein [Candidatus Micrarchaeota archaeon]